MIQLNALFDYLFECIFIRELIIATRWIHGRAYIQLGDPLPLLDQN